MLPLDDGIRFVVRGQRMAVGSRSMTKGAGIRSWSTFVDQRFGQGTVGRIVQTMPADLRQTWPDVLPNAWYPTSFLGHAWTALAEGQLGGDARAAERFFPELGRYIAEDNLTNLYRFLLSLMSPQRILGMTPRLWGTYFDSVKVEVQYETGRNEGRAIVSGIGGVPYLNLVAKGWLELAYVKCGAKAYSVDEVGWGEGRVAPEPMVFVHRWA